MENIKKSLEDLNLKVGTKNMDFEVSDVVYTTTNLNIFKFMDDGNRPVDKKHVNQLKDRLSEKYLRTIIKVNENMNIIDGQHRYTAIKELNEENRKKGLPLMSIEFIICKKCIFQPYGHNTGGISEYKIIGASHGHQYHIIHKVIIVTASRDSVRTLIVKIS